MRTQPTMHVIVKATIEQKLKYGDYPWTHTVLGPTLFFSNNLRAKESMLKEDLFDEPLGKAGVSRISVPDIALAVRNTLLNPTRRNSVIVSNGNIIAVQRLRDRPVASGDIGSLCGACEDLSELSLSPL